MRPLFVLIITTFLFSACTISLPDIDGYISLSSITKRGFAIDKELIQKKNRKQIKLWGYLDSHNIYLKKI